MAHATCFDSNANQIA